MPPLCDDCYAPLACGPDDGGAYLDTCDECSVDLCSACAGYWDVDGGYQDGTQVRITSRCKPCEAALSRRAS